jgi:tetrahydromethanopterin S-methyltransferase subunit H
MGYPMTFQRVVNRSGLGDGDYNTAPQRHQSRCITNATEASIASEEETMLARAPIWADRVDEYEKAFKMLAGDLRRLQSDAVDEGATCIHIAGRTGLDAEIVAAVLKEFMSW